MTKKSKNSSGVIFHYFPKISEFSFGPEIIFSGNSLGKMANCVGTRKAIFRFLSPREKYLLDLEKILTGALWIAQRESYQMRPSRAQIEARKVLFSRRLKHDFF